MILFILEWVPLAGQIISPHHGASLSIRHLWWGGKTPTWAGAEPSSTPQLGFPELQHLILDGTQQDMSQNSQLALLPPTLTHSSKALFISLSIGLLNLFLVPGISQELN